MKFSYASGATPLQGYTIKRGIGVGGFGEVYFAISDAGKEVALKKIQRNLDVELRGVRQCLNLNHVNLISLWDIKTNGAGQSWVVMEYVPGVSLRDVVEAFPHGMPEAEIKKWFAATAAGVAYLHKHGIVHRDLKPGNIFRDDDQHIVKIGDYGLSKFIACNRRSGHTEAVGTFHYMAPEIGKGEYGKEIDIYALGIVLFEMLTGDVPFNGESSQEIIMKHLTANVPLEKVSPGFHRVLQKSLNKNPHQRYSSVRAMAQELPWGDLATDRETIPAQYGAAPSSRTPKIAPGKQGPASIGKAQIAPIFVTGDSLEILRKDVVFGESNGAGDSATLDSATFDNATLENQQGVPVKHNPAIHKSTSPHRSRSSDPNDQPTDPAKPPNVPVSKQKTSAGRRQKSAAAIEWIADEPLLPAHPVIHWWNHGATATMGKLAIAGLAIAFAHGNPLMLPSIIFFAGIFYLVDYVRRHGNTRNKNKSAVAPNAVAPPRAPGSAAPPSHVLTVAERQMMIWSGLHPDQLHNARSWRTGHPMRERITELLGSLLVAALACIAFNLIPFALNASSLGEPNVELWSRFAYSTCLCSFACWAILVFGKIHELVPSKPPLCRGVIISLGLLTAITGVMAANFFGVPLVPPTLPSQTGMFANFQIRNIPAVPAYFVFFAVLFGSLRWWHQVDPLRKTRLNLWTVGLCFVWAVIFSHVLGRPVLLHGFFAIAVSTSIQLAAPWIEYAIRKQVACGPR